MQALVCGRVDVCNKQPKIDIHDHLNSSDSRAEIIQSDSGWDPVKRYHVTQRHLVNFFICIGGDVFLTPEQTDLLVRELIADPLRPYGVEGKRFIRMRQKSSSPVVFTSSIWWW